MVATMGADIYVFSEVTVKKHALAGGAFLPKIVGDILGSHDRANFWTNKIGKPVHEFLFLSAGDLKGGL